MSNGSVALHGLTSADDLPGGRSRTYSPDDLPAVAGGTAGEYALAGTDPAGGGRHLFGSVADDPVGN